MENKVAVIMSLYHLDDPEYLRESLDSLINQTERLSILLYQDGPINDALSEVLTEYRLNDIIIVKSDKNQGLAHALNKLIELALSLKFDYVARMDSDDICLPDRIEKQVEFLDANKDVDILGGCCSEFGASYALDYKSVPLDHSDILNSAITRCPIIHPSVMFRASIFDHGYRYPEDTSFTEDMALWLLLLSKDFKFSNLPDVLIKYRINEDTVSRRKGIKKGWSEFKLRFIYMIKLRRISLKNTTLIFSRLVFHILPVSAIKFAYDRLRSF